MLLEQVLAASNGPWSVGSRVSRPGQLVPEPHSALLPLQPSEAWAVESSHGILQQIQVYPPGKGKTKLQGLALGKS